MTLVAKPEIASEQELIAACIAGDLAAQRVLFRREYPRVNATIYRLIGSTRDLDDLVQETFIAAFRALSKFRGDAKLSTWIDRIAVRVVFQHIRARKKGVVPLDVIGEVADGSASVEGQTHAREGLRRLYAVLAALSPEQRMAFALYAIDGRSIADVARITGTTLVTAKLRIWRARKHVEKRAAADPALAELVAGAGEEEAS